MESGSIGGVAPCSWPVVLPPRRARWRAGAIGGVALVAGQSCFHRGELGGERARSGVVALVAASRASAETSYTGSVERLRIARSPVRCRFLGELLPVFRGLVMKISKSGRDKRRYTLYIATK